jgi:hypothetical protein
MPRRSRNPERRYRPFSGKNETHCTSAVDGGGLLGMEPMQSSPLADFLIVSPLGGNKEVLAVIKKSVANPVA